MGHSRRRPKLLPEKLLAIRKFLNLDQQEMAAKLDVQIRSHSETNYGLHPGRISEYETGQREPNLLVLLAYCRLAQVPMDSVADDEINVEHFRARLGKAIHDVVFSQSNEGEKWKKPILHIGGTR